MRTSDWRTIVHCVPLASEKPAELFWETEQKILWGASYVYHKTSDLWWAILPLEGGVRSSVWSQCLTMELCFSCFIFALTIAICIWHFSSVTHSLNCPCYILALISNLIPQYCSILNGLVTHLLFRKQYFNTIVSCT